MRKLLILGLLLVPSLVLPAEDQADGSQNPMAGWVPPKVTNATKDKQEIQALFHAMEAAGRKGDLEAATALVDFPVMMMTDDGKGAGKSEPWGREKWMDVMRPFYAKPMKDVKVTHKPSIFLLSDALASVDDVATMTMGGKTVTTRSSTLLLRKDGEWRIKAMAEGGWGNVMAAQERATAGPKGTEQEQGTGSAGTPPASGGTGGGASAPEAPKSQ
jgi:uncharacterized protein (TIGR02246 family)